MTEVQDVYWGTTAANLDHYFGNHVGMARLFHLDNPKPIKEAFDERKAKFIAGLEGTIAKNLPVYGGITQEVLREIIQLAQGNWSDIAVVKTLFRKYSELKPDEEYDERKVFEGK